MYFFSSERSKYWKISLFQIMHPGIENYFEGFDGAQYIPRPWLKAVFPHDWPWPLVISPWHFLIFLTFVKKKSYTWIFQEGWCTYRLKFIFLELLWLFGNILIYLNRVTGNSIFLCKINFGTYKLSFSQHHAVLTLSYHIYCTKKNPINLNNVECDLALKYFFLHILDFVIYRYILYLCILCFSFVFIW